ncbi:MAG: T9SS type A sorting domain-containing protein [Saprospiraceae bacterium]|nr:T9SS type A sorting domain-containing protein [Saprospiraceae bacterium]
MKSNFYFLFFLILASSSLQAQVVFIDTGYTAEQMVMDFFDNSCVTPSNVTFNGGPASMGFFEGANTDLGLNAGIVLSTGDVNLISASADVFASANNSTAGDADLDALVVPFQTFDAAILEFDILVSTPGDLNFEYVFGSEEYPEFVGSAFNDVFAFWLSDGVTTDNIALIPGTTDAVAINSVNADMNDIYYVPYQEQSGTTLVYDGFTTPLPATFTAMGDGMYHVKIAVADAGDGVFDSGVFIGIESLCGPMLLSPPTSFTLEQDGNTVSVVNESRYATSWHWDYGNGYETDERNPAPYDYPEDGTYTIVLTTENYCCSETFEYEVQVGETVAVHELVEKPFSVQPNPAQDYLLIESKDGAEMVYQLFDITGRLLYSGTVNGNTQLDLSGVDAGLYLLSIQTADQTYSERIIRN